MKIKQKIFLPVFLIALFGIACVNAAPKLKMDLRPDGLYLDNLNEKNFSRLRLCECY